MCLQARDKVNLTGRTDANWLKVYTVSKPERDQVEG